MWFIIVHGTTRQARIGEKGMFLCPTCLEDRPYHRTLDVLVKTIFWIPLWDLQTVGDWIVCQNCRSHYGAEVLTYTRERIFESVNPWRCVRCGKFNPEDREHCWHCQVSRYSNTW